VEISQHIKDLLFTQDRVVLPGFGAFTANYTPASVDKTTNTILPPSKDIVFDAETTISSGLLEKHMASKENIGVDDARAQIDELVKTVKSKLKAGKKVKFPELGTFSLEKSGKLLFVYQPTGNLLLDSYGLTKISLPENIAPEEIDKGETDGTKKKRGWIIWLAAAALIAILLTSIYFVKNEWWVSGKIYITEIFNKNDSGETDNNDSDKTEIADITDVTDNTDGKNTTDTTENTDSSVTDNDSNTTDTTPDDNTDKTPANNDTPVSSDDHNYTGQYKIPEKGKSYVIIASMANAQLAEAEKSALAAKGIQVDILPAGNNRYRLSLGAFENPNDAVVFYNDFHSKHKERTVWLWENR